MATGLPTDLAHANRCLSSFDGNRSQHASRQRARKKTPAREIGLFAPVRL
jgi:hypothetical protein